MELTDINGIGPASARKLRERGITTIKALAAVDFTTIADIHGAEEDWIIQAIDATEFNPMVDDEEPEDIFFNEDEDVYEAIPPVEVDLEDLPPNAQIVAVGLDDEFLLVVPFHPDDEDRLIALRDTEASLAHKPDLTLQDVVKRLIIARMNHWGIE